MKVKIPQHAREDLMDLRKTMVNAQSAAVFNRPDIQAYIISMVGPALARIEELSRTARSEAVRLLACQDLVNRGIGKPRETIDMNVESKVLLIRID